MSNQQEYNSEHLKNSELKLEQGEKSNPFKVPEGYFDDLPDAINEAISRQPDKSLHRYSAVQIGLSVAALIAVVIIAGWFVIIEEDQIKNDQINITYEDLLESGFVTEYDDNTLINHYISAYSESDESGNTVDYIDEYKDYLIQNDIDINILINEL